MEKVENDISHQLIEEFMLAANEAVARAVRHKPLPCIYRVHEKPDPEKLNEFREQAALQGHRAGDLTQRGELQKLLASLRGQPTEHALKVALLRSLKRARYSAEPLGHFGLAKTNYTHFTSPIRRYADLVVHRVLARIAGENGGAKQRPAAKAEFTGVGELEKAAMHISDTERNAADAERDAVMLKKLEYFQLQLNSRKPDSFEAVVTDVRNFGMFVELPGFQLSGLVHASALAGDFYQFDAARLRLVGQRTRKTFALGDRLEVIVARVDVFKQQIDFAPV
jgi:ribonuclease R